MGYRPSLLFVSGFILPVSISSPHRTQDCSVAHVCSLIFLLKTQPHVLTWDKALTPDSKSHSPLQAPSALTRAHLACLLMLGFLLLHCSKQEHNLAPIVQLVPRAHHSDLNLDGISLREPFLICRAGLRCTFMCFPLLWKKTTPSPVASLLVCHPLLTVRSGEAESMFPSWLFTHG